MAKKLDYANSLRRLRVDITQADIGKGKILDPHHCAAAVALLRATKATDVRVHRGVTYLLIGKTWKRYRTSAGLRMETIIFDRGGTFMPGEYDLQPVPLSAVLPHKPRSTSKGKSPKEAALATRRRVIPGVRRSARATEEDETDAST